MSIAKSRLTLLTVAAMSLVTACTRAVNDTPLKDAADVVIKPLMQDTKLSLKPVAPGAPHTKLAFAARPYSTAKYFQLVDDLRVLGRRESDDGLVALANGMYRSFYANPANYTRTTFLKGPIPNAIVGEGEAPIRGAVVSMDKDLRVAVEEFTKLLGASRRQFHWPSALPKLAPALGITDQYAEWLITSLQSLKIAGTMKAVAELQIREQYKKYRPILAAFAAGIDGAKSMREALNAVQRGTKQLGVKLQGADAEKLRQAGALADQLDEMEDAQDALATLITVWRITPEAEREPLFRKVSSDFYDFLESKSESDLNCLARKHCPNPVLGIAKLVIFKKLNEFGVDKIHAQIDAAGRDSIVDSAHQMVVKFLPSLPNLLRDTVVSQVAPYLKTIAKIRADVAGFTRSHLEPWAAKNLALPLKGLEAGSVTVSLQARDQISVIPVAPKRGGGLTIVDTGAETLGASLSLAQTFLPAQNGPGLQAALLEPIMKLLAIGGFRQANGKPFPNFLLPIDGPVQKIFQLPNLMKEPTTYAVPDSFQANEQFQMDRVHARKNVSVAAQAELLRGIARQVGFYRDWEQNIYDVSLGKILVEDLVAEIPKGLVKTGLLPKDVLFAMALGNAGALLENLVLEATPAFLVLEKGEILWGDRYQEIRGDKVSAVAGIVSIVDGKRTDVVKTGDVARYVLALDEFMAASEGMEKSTSAILLKPTNDGKSTLLADLVEIRKKLSLVQMGLTNYLVYVALQPDGSLGAEFRVGRGMEKIAGARHLEDQALAIRALLASAKRLELPLFRWSALDIYYGMNKNFFDADRQFYGTELSADGKHSGTAGLGQVVQVLLAGEELTDFMPTEARAQWEQLAKPWLKALQNL